MRKINGFTLIELMIVVAIIGVLASIALPSYQKYIIRAQIVEALTLSNEVKPGVYEFYKQTGRFPKNNAEAGVPKATYLLGNYVKSVNVVNGAINVRLGNKITAPLQDKILSIRPASVTGSPMSPISWLCGYAKPVSGMQENGVQATDVGREYLPAVCRL